MQFCLLAYSLSQMHEKPQIAVIWGKQGTLQAAVKIVEKM